MTMGQPLRMPPPPRREIAGAETCRAPAQVTWNARRLGRAADGARAAALGAGVPASVVEAALDAWRAAAEGMALLPFVAWASEDDVLGHRVWGERFLRILAAVATAEDRGAARAAAAACAARRGSAVARREALIQCGWRLGLQFGSAAAWENRGRDAGYARSSSSSSAETVSSLSSDDEGDKGPPPSPFATLLRAFVERTALGLGGDEARDLAARCEALLQAAARVGDGAPCAPLGAGVLTLAEVLDACRSTTGICGGPLALEVLDWLEAHVREKVAAGPCAAPRPQRRLAATGAGSSEALFANFLADFGQAANATFCTRAWRRYAFEPRAASFVPRWARACCECLVRGAGAPQVHARDDGGASTVDADAVPGRPSVAAALLEIVAHNSPLDLAQTLLRVDGESTRVSAAAQRAGTVTGGWLSPYSFRLARGRTLHMRRCFVRDPITSTSCFAVAATLG